MMAGNPNHWWSMYPQLSSPSHQFVDSSTNEDQNPNQDFPIRSWSQLLLGGGEEDKFGGSIFEQQKKIENWEDQVVLNLSSPPAISYTTSSSTSTSWFPVVDVKQEALAGSQILQNQHFYHHHHAHKPSTKTTSSITITNNFSAAGKTTTPPLLEGKINNHHHHHHHHHSSQCNSSGGVSKKARVQQSSAQQPAALKVSKEKVRDRITALHQIVSPFGKTDTASVLSESIGCIRILQAQIEALSSPYMRHASESTGHHQHSFLNHEIDMGGSGASKQDSLEGQGAKNLRSLGLCLVPISFIQLVGDDNGADYWAPPATLGGGF